MECSEALLWASEYIDGTLPSDTCAELEKHLSVCPRCKSILNTLKATISLYQSVKSQNVPSAIHHSLHRALRYEWETHKVKVGIRYSGFPLVELIDKKKEFDLLIELPGLKREDLTLMATSHSIEISGFRERVEGIYYQNEINYGHFSRLIKFSNPIDPLKVDAHLKDGLLKIRLPKI